MASSGWRTGEAEVEDDDGASGAAVDDGRERGGGTTSVLGAAETNFFKLLLFDRKWILSRY